MVCCVIQSNFYCRLIARGRLDLVNDFLQLGADPAQTAGQWTASKLARNMDQHSVADFLERHQLDKAESLLRIYKDRHDEEVVNVDLVLDLLHVIEKSSSEGAVLIFLPGYEEIMSIRDRIIYNDSRFAGSGKFEVLDRNLIVTLRFFSKSF